MLQNSKSTQGTFGLAQLSRGTHTGQREEEEGKNSHREAKKIKMNVWLSAVTMTEKQQTKLGINLNIMALAIDSRLNHVTMYHSIASFSQFSCVFFPNRLDDKGGEKNSKSYKTIYETRSWISKHWDIVHIVSSMCVEGTNGYEYIGNHFPFLC